MENEKLKFLIALSKEVDNTENEEIKKEFYELAMEELSKNNYPKTDKEILDKINEYCIENVIRNQSVSFYSGFPLNLITDKLVSDYAMMEHYRRRDDFENFCIAVFQQIENIVNYIFINYNLIELLIKNSNQIAFTNFKGERYGWPLLSLLLKVDHKYYVQDSQVQLKERQKWLNDNKDKPDKFDFMTRSKTVLYFYYFNENVENQRVFQDRFALLHELSQIRNLVHRGTPSFGKSMEIQNKVLKDKYKYYFMFHGLLVDFVIKIGNVLLKNLDSIKNVEVESYGLKPVE